MLLSEFYPMGRPVGTDRRAAAWGRSAQNKAWKLAHHEG